MGQSRLFLTIVTPEKTVLDGKAVDSVTLPAFAGEMGILPGHASYVIQLKEGILRYSDGTHREVFAVLSGFAKIHLNKVMVLAEAAELAEEVNEERARQAYKKAKENINVRGADLDLDEANAALRRAVARLKAAEFRTKRT